MNPRRKHSRTICSCGGCRAGCLHMPGMLIPGDIERIGDKLEPANEWNCEQRHAWVQQHFCASTGAMVVMDDGTRRRIPTIVPRLTEHGCVFLTGDGLCSIHDVAPYGCAFLDVHMSLAAGDPIVKDGLAFIMDDQSADWLDEYDDENECTPGLYHVLWASLASDGIVAPPISERRRNFQRAMEQFEGE